MAGATIHPEALAAALAGAAKAPPPGYVQDPNAQGAGGGGAPTDPSQGGGGGAPTDPSQDPNAQGGAAPTDPTQDPNAQGQDPNQQAIWQEFPATDPSQIEQLAQQMQQGGDPQQLIELLTGFMQQAQSETDKLSQMHTAMLTHLMDILQGGGQGQGDLMSPGGQGQPMPSGPSPVASQGPGVGGGGSGY